MASLHITNEPMPITDPAGMHTIPHTQRSLSKQQELGTAEHALRQQTNAPGGSSVLLRGRHDAWRYGSSPPLHCQLHCAQRGLSTPWRRSARRSGHAAALGTMNSQLPGTPAKGRAPRVSWTAGVLRAALRHQPAAATLARTAAAMPHASCLSRRSTLLQKVTCTATVSDAMQPLAVIMSA